MKLPDHLQLDENLRFRRVGDEGVVVDQRSAEIMVVTEVAVRSLELIRKTGSRQRVLDTIVEEYEVASDKAQADLDRFLEELDNRNLLAKVIQDVR